MTDVVVLGASLAALWTAAAAAQAGASVLLLDRDRAPTGPSLRAGVPQGSQPHVLLHRGLRAGEELLPGLRRDLLAAGAISVDTGRLPWLGEHGWLPTESSFDVLSLTRPLLEHVVRERVLALPGVHLRWGVQAGGLIRCDGGWRVRVSDGGEIAAPLVVDATGRASRLRRWVAELGVTTPEPLTVDARLGYATQLVAGGPDPRDLPGVVLQATPQSPVGGIALPVEGRHWQVAAVGFGAQRPPRDRDGFAAFLDALPDSALSTILRSGQPVGEVLVHRQTGNRRQRYAQVKGWPDGLLAVGDALCCFDPVYGQGITASVCEALHVRAALAAGPRAGTAGQLLRRFDRVIDFPWAVAIGQDLQMPSSSGRQSRVQAAVSAWASQVARRAVQGDDRAHQTLMRAYHLESSPSALLHPALIASVAFGRVRHISVPAPRPPVLERLAA
jgi:2-polyprenyl-6-methoxyphenol hydroxylase-like FAD-dependent oxidoreductase